MKKIIISIVILLLCLFAIYDFKNRIVTLFLSTQKFNHNTFEFISSSYLSFDPNKEHIFMLQKRCNAAEFRIRENNQLLLTVNYDGLYETLKYKIFDDTIIFWVNGEPDKYTSNHTSRNNTLLKVFEYNIRTSAVKELYTSINKNIVIDVQKKEGKYIIQMRQALELSNTGKWIESVIVINDNQTKDITISYESEFSGSFLQFGDSYIVAGEDGIYVIDDNEKKIYSYLDRECVKLLVKNEQIYAFIDNKIVLFNELFETVKEFEYERNILYYDIYFVGDKFWLCTKYEEVDKCTEIDDTLNNIVYN